MLWHSECGLLWLGVLAAGIHTGLWSGCGDNDDIYVNTWVGWWSGCDDNDDIYVNTWVG